MLRVPFRALCAVLDRIERGDKPVNSRASGLSRGRAAPLALLFAQITDRIRSRWPPSTAARFSPNLFPLLRLVVPGADPRRAQMQQRAVAELYSRAFALAGEAARAVKDYKGAAGGALDRDVSRAIEAAVGPYLPPPPPTAAAAAAAAAAAGGEVTVGDVNAYLDALAASAGLPERLRALQPLRTRLTAREHRWLVRITLRDLKLNLGVTAVLAAYHPRGAEVFAAKADLSGACALLSDTRSLGAFTGETSVFSPFLVMLAEVHDPASPARADAGSAVFIAQDKFDGERIVVHKLGGRIKLFSRSTKDYTDAYAKRFVRDCGAAIAHLRDCVLDGELLTWNATKGRVEPPWVNKAGANDFGGGAVARAVYGGFVGRGTWAGDGKKGGGKQKGADNDDDNDGDEYDYHRDEGDNDDDGGDNKSNTTSTKGLSATDAASAAPAGPGRGGAGVAGAGATVHVLDAFGFPPPKELDATGSGDDDDEGGLDGDGDYEVGRDDSGRAVLAAELEAKTNHSSSGGSVGGISESVPPRVGPSGADGDPIDPTDSLHFYYIVFDTLHMSGQCLASLPYAQRRRALVRALTLSGPAASAAAAAAAAPGGGGGYLTTIPRRFELAKDTLFIPPSLVPAAAAAARIRGGGGGGGSLGAGGAGAEGTWVPGSPPATPAPRTCRPPVSTPPRPQPCTRACSRRSAAASRAPCSSPWGAGTSSTDAAKRCGASSSPTTWTGPLLPSTPWY